MKKTQNLIALLLAASLAMTACNQKLNVSEIASPSSQVVTATPSPVETYLGKVDTKYSYDLAIAMTQFKDNEKLGYRTAGSDAENKTGDFILNEMKKIGLTEVTKDEFTLDTWEFEKAELSFTLADGKEHKSLLGGYQVNFDTQGVKEYEIVYAGKGTKKDLANLDVKGKLVLVDINQDEEWWINYPTYQAKMKGAAALIACQEAGFAEVSPDALNANDICGPADAPAFSMSNTDGNKLKESLTKSNNSLTVKFDAKSTVGMNGKAYNIRGQITGKDPNSYILLSAHHDAYFDGFQDDSVAVTLMMGVAKALVESGYKPEKTIIFNSLAAEEWGLSNSRYDWSTGAYNQIFRVHPEWQGKAVANINFEMPAHKHTEPVIRSIYELDGYLSDFAKTITMPVGLFEKEIAVTSPLATWSDDYSFALAGVPAFRNSYKGTDFSTQIYHSQYDNKDTYVEDIFKFNHDLYGQLVIYYDQTAVVPMDFSTRFDTMLNRIEQVIFDSASVDNSGLISSAKTVIENSGKLSDKIKKINDDYRNAIVSGNTEQVKKIYEESRSLNDQLLKIFKYAQDNLIKLTWEDVEIFEHQHSSNNLKALNGALVALKAGDVATAYDDYLNSVDNNWYAYNFDKDVFNYFTNYVLNQPADRLNWGAGRIVGHTDLYDVINSLSEKYDIKPTDLTKEIAVVETAIKNQTELLNTAVSNQMKHTNEINKMISSII